MDASYFFSQGVYFGYPTCCIHAFIKRAQVIFETQQPSPYPDGPWLDTGFLPCDDCQKMILARGLDRYVRFVIVEHRHCEIEFPKG